MGAFFSYGDMRLGQGREAAKDFLRQNPDIAQEIEELIIAASAALSQPPEPSKNGRTPAAVSALDEGPDLPE